MSLQTVLSGDVYTNLSFLVDMMDVSLELLDSPTPTEHKRSLARFLSSYRPVKNIHIHRYTYDVLWEASEVTQIIVKNNLSLL